MNNTNNASVEKDLREKILCLLDQADERKLRIIYYFLLGIISKG